eukprot:GFUD01035868.1.p1 GENE.GFUD01035868.1~~GFUD01035868.1.p1  ORF type:complete len:380 (+),score=110.30 GFUD01035868.1:38-1177(+)
MRQLLISWKNYDTCENCAFQLKKDVENTLSSIVVGYLTYLYLDPLNPGLWWWWISIYTFCTVDHFYMLCCPQSPPLSLLWEWAREGNTEGESATKFQEWKKKIGAKYYHIHGESLEEAEDEKEKLDKQTLETGEDKQDSIGKQKKLTKKEEKLKKSLGEQKEKLKKWEQTFEDWSSSKANEMAKRVSEETNAEEQNSTFCRERERVREEIARLELESKDLATKIVESETNRIKLVKKRHKLEARTDARLYEQKIEKTKYIDAIQKIKLELSRIQEYERIENKKKDTSDLKAKRTNQLAIEIEEKERDLECPVCFEVCTKPIFMCDISHQICKQCRPKMKVCPQCREQYKKYKKRNTVQEMKRDQLQVLYKDVREVLEAD